MVKKNQIVIVHKINIYIDNEGNLKTNNQNKGCDQNCQIVDTRLPYKYESMLIYQQQAILG